jgi:hypothetical protein
MRLATLFLIASVGLVTGCDGEKPDTDPTGDSAAEETGSSDDHDGDGIISSVDCDDEDAAVAGPAGYWPDDDGDGYGQDTDAAYACEAPAGTSPNSGDCDDRSADIHPGVAETCNDLDDDCNGTADDGVADAPFWYPDLDADGFGSAVAITQSCRNPGASSLKSTDCDDADPGVHPGVELPTCGDAMDYDCDGEDDFVDADGDGFTSCRDCDDTDATLNPAATEVCDGVDNNCDGHADDDAVDRPLWYADRDRDGFGDADAQMFSCDAGTAVANADDCDDARADVNPTATEICGGGDEDCDGLVDDADAGVTGAPSWYADADADGYGDPATVGIACEAPTGSVSDATDCDDTDGAVSPGATELCDDGSDDDCDGSDDGCALAGTYAASDADHVLLGLGPTDAFGTLVGAGDLDGDGAADLAVAADGYGGDAGGTWIFLGPLATTDTVATADATILGGSLGDRLGGALAGAGDLDGDGRGDLVLGADGWDGAATDAGAAFLLSGPATGALTSADALATIRGLDADGAVGTGVAGPGDFDGDGADDLLVGAPGVGASGTGAAAVFFGPIAGDVDFDAATAARITGVDAYDGLGGVVSGAGDTDGDGTGEILLGAAGVDGTAGVDAGAVYVFSALAAGTYAASTADVTFAGDAPGDALGIAVCGVGDIDADGYADILVGASAADVGSETDAGAAWIVLGTAAGLPPGTISDVATALFTGATAGDAVGGAVAGGDDVNGDGYADLLVGATGYDTPAAEAGATFLVFGPVSGSHSLGSYAVAGDADAALVGELAGDGFGASVGVLGDTDGDGYAELGAGTPGYAGGSGAAWIFAGGGI